MTSFDFDRPQMTVYFEISYLWHWWFWLVVSWLILCLIQLLNLLPFLLFELIQLPNPILSWHHPNHVESSLSRELLRLILFSLNLKNNGLECYEITDLLCKLANAGDFLRLNLNFLIQKTRKDEQKSSWNVMHVFMKNI